jgi:hypothetical protein
MKTFMQRSYSFEILSRTGDVALPGFPIPKDAEESRDACGVHDTRWHAEHTEKFFPSDVSLVRPDCTLHGTGDDEDPAIDQIMPVWLNELASRCKPNFQLIATAFPKPDADATIVPAQE